MNSHEQIKTPGSENVNLANIETQRRIMLLWAERKGLNTQSHNEIAKQWINSGVAEIYSDFVANPELPKILHLDNSEEMESFWSVLEPKV